MIKDGMLLDILSCFKYNQPKWRNRQEKRSFSALSLRLNTSCTYVSSGVKTEVPIGGLALIPAGVEYTTISEAGELYVIHFRALDEDTDKVTLLDCGRFNEYLPLFEEAIRIWESRESGYKTKCTALLYSIVGKVLENLSPVEGKRGSLVPIAEKYINHHLTDRTLTVAAVARHAYVSEALLRRKFKAQTGMSPKEYIITQRIEMAKQLLETGSFSQGEISERCGFADVKYFRCAFKNQVGISPREYQKSLSK